MLWYCVVMGRKFSSVVTTVRWTRQDNYSVTELHSTQSRCLNCVEKLSPNSWRQLKSCLAPAVSESWMRLQFKNYVTATLKLDIWPIICRYNDMYSGSQRHAFVAFAVLNADSAERERHRPTMKTHLCGPSQALVSELTFPTLTDEVITAGDVVPVSLITALRPGGQEALKHPPDWVSQPNKPEYYLHQVKAEYKAHVSESSLQVTTSSLPRLLRRFQGQKRSRHDQYSCQSITDPALGSAQQLTAATQITAPEFNMGYSEVAITPAPFQRSCIKHTERLESFC